VRDTGAGAGTLAQAAAGVQADGAGTRLTMGVGIPLQQAQREFIAATLDMYQGDKRLAARTLGISLKTLYNRMDARRDDEHPARSGTR